MLARHLVDAKMGQAEAERQLRCVEGLEEGSQAALKGHALHHSCAVQSGPVASPAAQSVWLS